MSLRVRGRPAKLGAEGVAASGDVAERLIGGQARQVLASAGGHRATLDAAIQTSFASGLNEVLLVAGAIGLVGGALSAVLLRPARAVAGEAEEGRRELAGVR